MKEETPYVSTEKKSSGQVEGSVPKLRKKIMKVVSLLVDAETAEDIEKAREKLQKMVDKGKYCAFIDLNFGFNKLIFLFFETFSAATKAPCTWYSTFYSFTA